MSLQIRTLAYASPEYDQAVALRRKLLRTPLGLDFTPEQLAAEAGDIHFAGFLDGEMVATVVLTPYGDDGFKLRQMAVDDGMQGRAIGSRLLHAAEAFASAAGRPHIALAARVTAENFYARAGYVSEGDVYTEVTIPHIRMWKDLNVRID